MFDSKMKALTFSYDDGILQDERLISLFNKYGLKATFNLNSELLGREGSLYVDDKLVNHTKIDPLKIEKIYAGHEVAVHTLTHPNLTGLEESKVIRQVEQDRINLSNLVGYDICGMAYPCGGVNNDERVAQIICENTGVKYARTITSTYSFKLQNSLYRFNPTIHHREWDKLEELIKQFIDAKPSEPMLFYIWGHSYELDANNEWDKLEDVCKILSNRDDMFYGTNREVLL